MISAQIRWPFQRADKRGQVSRKLRDLIPGPARIIGTRVISHDRSLSPRPPADVAGDSSGVAAHGQPGGGALGIAARGVVRGAIDDDGVTRRASDKDTGSRKG